MKRFAALLAVPLVAASVAACTPELGPSTSSTQGVTVKVVPKTIAPDAARWEFVVVLDTHTKSLDENLLRAAVLLDAQGVAHAPIAWEGTPPGGRHRSGVLRFKPLTPMPKVLELRIERPGESGPRVFQWKLG